jgi:hypothetical protein
VNLEAFVDLDSPQFGVAPNCKVGKAKLFCVPAEKAVISARDKATKLPITPLPVTGPNPGDRICYKVKCPEPFPPDTQVTDQFGTRTVTKFKTQLLCTPAVKGGVPPRFVDNGDGTVTDNQTGLQWEKKVSPGGGATDPHDVDNVYTWWLGAGGPFAGCPDGTAFTDFLGRLNNCTSSDGTTATSAGFAGRCDWRLPTVQELQTIVDLGAAGCGTGTPCIDPVFGPTDTGYYWSATHSSVLLAAWSVRFSDGFVNDIEFLGPVAGPVRAVRPGS